MARSKIWRRKTGRLYSGSRGSRNFLSESVEIRPIRIVFRPAAPPVSVRSNARTMGAEIGRGSAAASLLASVAVRNLLEGEVVAEYLLGLLPELLGGPLPGGNTIRRQARANHLSNDNS